MNTIPTTETPDPKNHPNHYQRYNPDAWRDCSIPPTPLGELNAHAFPSWRVFDDPRDAECAYTHRARSMLGFLRSMLNGWDDTAFNFEAKNPEGVLPLLTLTRQDVVGLAEILGVIGECIDLASNAADAASMEEQK
ncbi:MAG: hypothetical protein HQL90_12945 [Magnetococcales bacterium]|nr:hypothetical protein [Magnetococcales bacterium]